MPPAAMGSAAAAVAATDADAATGRREPRKRQTPADALAAPGAARATGAIVAAAMLLPGVWCEAAHAEGAPESGLIAFKYLHYQDSQPGLQRVKVESPSLFVLVPWGPNWSLEGSLVSDAVSGATPRWQSAVSSASVMHEERRAADVKVTRYYDRSSYAFGLSRSNEHDYKSNSVSFNGRWSTPDNNTTWQIGVASTEDTIEPTAGAVNTSGPHKKRADEMLVSLTQAMTPSDLMQLNLTITSGEGYFNDPYKLLDVRPSARKQAALLGRWNKFLSADGSTLRSSYRYYRDSFGIRAHTFQLDWARPVTRQLVLTPSLRYYAQSAARFYVDAQYDAASNVVLPTPAADALISGDQRLSAFGAITLGLKAEWQLDADWALDAKLERYEQRSSWRWFGTGSPALDPFRATIVQLGVRRRF